MKLDRAQLKMAARNSMAQANPGARLVTLVYVLLTSVLTTVIQTAMGNPFKEITNMVAQGYDPEWAFYTVTNSVSLPLVAFVSILLALYTVVMGYGYVAYCLRLSRQDESAGIGTLIEGFSMVGKVLLTHILVAVFTMLWGLALAIPLALVVGLSVAVGGGIGIAIIVVAYIAYFIGVIYFVLRYALADYALFDNPEAGCLAAVRTSKELMQGHKGEFFVLGLSFLGWIILVALLAGIGSAIGGALGALTGNITLATIIGVVVGELAALPLSLWLTPYQGCTFAHYYNERTGQGQNPEQPSNPAGDFPYL